MAVDFCHSMLQWCFFLVLVLYTLISSSRRALYAGLLKHCEFLSLSSHLLEEAVPPKTAPLEQQKKSNQITISTSSPAIDLLMPSCSTPHHFYQVDSASSNKAVTHNTGGRCWITLNRSTSPSNRRSNAARVALERRGRWPKIGSRKNLPTQRHIPRAYPHHQTTQTSETCAARGLLVFFLYFFSKREQPRSVFERWPPQCLELGARGAYNTRSSVVVCESWAVVVVCGKVDVGSIVELRGSTWAMGGGWVFGWGVVVMVEHGTMHMRTTNVHCAMDEGRGWNGWNWVMGGGRVVIRRQATHSQRRQWQVVELCAPRTAGAVFVQKQTSLRPGQPRDSCHHGKNGGFGRWGRKSTELPRYSWEIL